MKKIILRYSSRGILTPKVILIILFVSHLLMIPTDGFSQFTTTTSIGASQENWNSAGAWSFPAGFTPFEGFPSNDFDEDATTTAFGGDYGQILIIDTNDNIKIPNNTIIDLTNSGITQITIRSGAELHFGSNSKLLLPASAVIVVESGAQIISDSNSVGIYLEIGGNGVWGRGCEDIGCNNNDLTGPGTITKDSTPGSPLPVTLLFFYAVADENGTELKWATGSELNFDRFVIERTWNGRSFVEIGSVPGNGISTSRIDYAYRDKEIMLGRTYYRLKAIDVDGFTEYFGMVSVMRDGFEDVRVHPNPTISGVLNLTFNYFSEEPAFFRITNISGLEILSGVIQRDGFDS